jgi:hypothetical protein
MWKLRLAHLRISYDQYDHLAAARVFRAPAASRGCNLEEGSDARVNRAHKKLGFLFLALSMRVK